MNMEKQIAVFDFDGTLIRGDSVVALLFYARKKVKQPSGRFTFSFLRRFPPAPNTDG